ncbi:hypothetical protein EGW08_010768 [Elysia chlorotica]|uniref:Uncharacterized protein n=1 Tax=Elysia chlorotica TaxID=188477 RepID=A0A433TIP3_ELYCH|nr:hypothetical protein EGW08_010768 [Elysia chlorotica]
MESQLFGFLVIASVCVCSCTCASLQTDSRRQEDIQHLVSLLGKLKNIERVRQQQHHRSHHHSKQQQQQLQVLPGLDLSSGSPSSSEFLPSEANKPDLDSRDVTNTLLLGSDGDDLDLDLTEAGAAEGLLEGGSNSAGSVSAVGKSKRQGAWSYDYGLGGGRFGKRNYGDYGYGGGRFGRDVDHVDITDISDADASTL